MGFKALSDQTFQSFKPDQRRERLHKFAEFQLASFLAQRGEGGGPQSSYQDIVSRILCYPRPKTSEQLDERVQELVQAGVDSIVFEGTTTAFGGGPSILGKGSVGLVLLCRASGRQLAVKVLRSDANRASLVSEAHCTLKANSVGVGPTVDSFGPNFILMERVFGDGVFDFVRKLSRGRTKVLKKVLNSVLEQARLLDKVGLEHGQLSNPARHVLVSDDLSVKVIDFETSRLVSHEGRENNFRTAKNVTQVAQALFIGGKYSGKVLRMLRVVPSTSKRKREPRQRDGETVDIRRNLQHLLRAYKISPSDEIFQSLTAFLRLS